MPSWNVRFLGALTDAEFAKLAAADGITWTDGGSTIRNEGGRQVLHVGIARNDVVVDEAETADEAVAAIREALGANAGLMRDWQAEQV